VKVTRPDGLTVTGTPREIADLAADIAPFPPGQPRHLVVAGRPHARIWRGEFGEEGQLPPTRELMAHYGVSVDVVSHARRELKKRGLVRSAGPRGTFAAPRPSRRGSGGQAVPAER
jgi:DNA-binding GntR family transcriptional regulator